MIDLRALLALWVTYVEDEDLNRCYECGDDWPCATIRSIDDVMCPTCGEPHPCLTERALDGGVTL